MLVILPPSETERAAPTGGPPLDLARLAFPSLNPMRERVIAALIETSGQPDALSRLLVRPRLIGAVMRNLDLRLAPTQPAWLLFAGPLYQGLDPASLSAAAIDRAQRSVVIASALFGALRPADPIPAHRLNVCARLVGMDRLEPIWRTVLPAVLAQAAGPRGVVLDLRSSSYAAIGSPAGMADRLVVLRVLPEPGKRHIGDVDAKRLRGMVTRELLESGQEPAGPDELADLLGARWPVRLDPAAPGKPWTIRIRPTD